ncbi:alpha/beta fold hydrolase [Nocardia callitridis]|uniref:Alpha/beta fold hydrolase n=1 Tax=Nocardia callitridis TaxID=648753 RepID=A0ABP9K3V5_9NOCA
MTEPADQPDLPTASDHTGTLPPDRRWTVTGGADIAVFEWGDPNAEPLVLVHGLTDTHDIWARVATLLADGFRVITYDVRGHGHSEVPAGRCDYRLDRLAEDFFAIVDAASPGTPVHACGHGWGAVQLWEAACDPRANTRVASFTAISGPNLDHLGLWLRAALPIARRRAIDPAWWVRGASTLAPATIARRLATPRARALLVRQLGGAVAVPARVATTWRSDLLAGARIADANVAHHLRKPRLRRTAVPVQLLVDTTDPFVPLSVYGASGRWVDRLWRCAVPADHWLPITEPLLVAEAIANFVDDLRADHAASTPRSG